MAAKCTDGCRWQKNKQTHRKQAKCIIEINNIVSFIIIFFYCSV